MSHQVVVGVDIGTGGCKVVVFDLEGHLVAEAFKEYPVYHPRTDWAEQDPDEWWKAACSAMKQALSRSRACEVVAVGLTSQREAFVPIDKEGKKLYNSIIWLDLRAVPQEKEIKKLIPPSEVLEITGVPVDYIFSAPKLLWLKENKPEVLSRAKVILFAKDYIAFKLCGEIATDYSMASRTMLFDIRRLRWSEKICEALRIPMELLPPVKGAWEVVGEVTTEASKLTGLPKGTPVVTGGGDRPCEALGAGAYEEGLVNIGTGTGTVFEVPLSKPRPDPRGLIDCCCHVVPATWEYEIIINATGESLRWFRDNFGYEELCIAREKGTSAYVLFDQEASGIPPGAEGLLYYPYLWGARAPKFNPQARAAFVGITHAHRRPHFIRAILEGVAFQYVGTLQLIEALGIKIRRISMTGGEARSDLWNQIKADVLGRKIEIPQVLDAAALGACILAAVGVGAYRDFRTAVSKMVRIARAYTPNPERHEKYMRVYATYQRVYELLEDSFRILASMGV